MAAPHALTARDVAWGGGWAAAIAVGQVQLWGLDPLQFGVQYLLTAMALLIPGLLLLNLRSGKGRRLPIRWQVVGILLLASLIAMGPWVSTAIGCPDC